MRSFLAALRSLVLPFGRTTGARIVLDGVNGIFQVYDASNVKRLEINTQDVTPGLTVFYDGTGNSFAELFGQELFIADPNGTFGQAGTVEITATTFQYQSVGVNNNPGIIEYIPGVAVDSQYFQTSLHWRATQPVNSLSTVETWHGFSFFNGWSNYGGGYANGEYRRMPDGTVLLRGAIKGGTLADGTKIINLPAGYRPTPTNTDIPVASVGTNTRLNINNTGDINIFGMGAATVITVDGVRFPVEI